MAELYLVEFKGSRRALFFNTYYHNLTRSEHVIVQAERGEDIGVLRCLASEDIDMTGREKPRSILRRASEDDLIALNDIRERELTYRDEIIELIGSHRLSMRIVDIEYQFDGNKMTVFFTADHRIDFRELVKDLASRYRTRIELRQIGVRDEARRIDGHGICGYRQCCSSFIINFAPVSTQQAREQNLPLNPSKISGNCGRLLCCLRYEVDQYVECRQKFPPVGSRVSTSLGDGIIDRIDIFQEEAVLRTEDSVFLRIPLKEFQPDPEPPSPGDPLEEATDSEVEVEASGIESLDDSDGIDDLDPVVEEPAEELESADDPPSPSEPSPETVPETTSDSSHQPAMTETTNTAEAKSDDSQPPRRRFRRRRPRRSGPRNNSQ